MGHVSDPISMLKNIGNCSVIYIGLLLVQNWPKRRIRGSVRSSSHHLLPDIGPSFGRMRLDFGRFITEQPKRFEERLKGIYRNLWAASSTCEEMGSSPVFPIASLDSKRYLPFSVLITQFFTKNSEFGVLISSSAKSQRTLSLAFFCHIQGNLDPYIPQYTILPFFLTILQKECL